MSLVQNITDIQNKLRRNEYPNEQSISQGIVLRLLSVLKWDIYDIRLVMPEYSIQGRRVDFALCDRPDKPIIFIEVKQPGNTLGADKQLFEYAFHKGVPFAIVTDGKEWHFYLPAEVGNYDERRIYKLDILERDAQESAYRLERYLTFEYVANGSALECAREDYRNVSKERQAEENIPIAWQKLIEEKDEMLIEVISEKVESICGFKPTQEQILSYVSTLKTSFTNQVAPLPIKVGKSDSTTRTPVASRTVTSKRAKIKTTFPDGTQICLPKVADTMVEVIRKIGFDRVGSLDKKVYGFPIVSNIPHRQDTYNWSKAEDGIFVFTHSNTKTKLKWLNEINEELGLGLKIESINAI